MKVPGVHGDFFTCLCGGALTVVNIGPNFDRKRDMTCSKKCQTPLTDPADFLEFRRALAGGASDAEIGAEITRNEGVMKAMKSYGKHAVGSRNLVLRPGEANPNVGVKNKAKENRVNVLRRIITLHIAQLDNEEAEIMELGTYLATKLEGYGYATAKDLKWVQAKRKGVDRALEKALDAAWDIGASNRDWIRGTIVAREPLDLTVAVEKLKNTISSLYGFLLPKEKQVRAEDDPCGYSGWNFNVTSRNGMVRLEVQANTDALIYGKEGKEVFKSMTGYNSGEYADLAAKMGTQGGLGHALYEIQRSTKDTKLAVDAADRSKEYYGLCRNYQTMDRQKKQAVNKSLAEFGGSLNGDAKKAAKAIWKHAGGPVR